MKGNLQKRRRNYSPYRYLVKHLVGKKIHCTNHKDDRQYYKINNIIEKTLQRTTKSQLKHEKLLNIFRVMQIKSIVRCHYIFTTLYSKWKIMEYTKVFQEYGKTGTFILYK